MLLKKPINLEFCFLSMCAKLLQSYPTLCDPWAVAHQAPLSMGYSMGFRVCCHTLLQGIFPTLGSNLHLLCLLH